MKRAMRDAVATLVERAEVRKQISPGFYFQRCLELWRPGLRETDKEAKATAVKPIEGPGASPVGGDPDLHRATLNRQAEVFASLRARFDGLEWQLRSLTPFVTGIGSPHPLENGFAFLKPYGVPYLAGSGVKGAVRAACTADWTERADAERAGRLLLHYFGSEDKDPRAGRGEDHQRGALVFLDLFPEPPAAGSASVASPYRLDVVNPHYGMYYQAKSVPAEWLAPVPSYFLTLRGDLEWHLRVLYAPASRQTSRARWIEEIAPGLERALTESGLGAKKSWGYGLFAILRRTAGASPERPASATTKLESGGPAGASAAAAETPAADGAAAARQAPAPSAPGISATVEAARAFIAALRAHEVKGRISELERALRACPEGDQPALLAEVEQKLKSFGFPRREIRDVLERLRRALGLETS